MIKFLTLLNFSGILLFELLFSGDISVTHDIPPSMVPGSEVKVTVKVDKEDLGGFAKLQIDLPQGFTASAIETKGASFTFSDGKAKFIWMALPAQSTFTVSYTLSVAADVSGSMPVTGRFSYIKDNERRTKDMPAATISVGSSTLAAAPTTQNTTTTSSYDPMDDVVSAAGGAGSVASPPAPVVHSVNHTIIPAQQGAGQVNGTRTITPVNAQEVLVEVTVKKGNIRGFGKLQETIPAGFNAVGQANDEAIFTAQDRTVKFVWLNLPARNELKISYKLRGPVDAAGEFAVNGEFGYLLNDETQKAVLGTTLFRMGAAAMADEPVIAAVTPTQAEPTPQPVTVRPTTTQPEPVRTPAPTPAVATTTKPDPAPTASTKRPVAVQHVPGSTPSLPKQPAKQPQQATAQKPRTVVPSPEKGISYKVQITAAHREVGSPYFQKRHRYFGDFAIEHHDGWIKYVTGRFSAFGDARRQRDKFVADGHAFPGPFVTAYNNGERITVQEALMIANQSRAN